MQARTSYALNALLAITVTVQHRPHAQPAKPVQLALATRWCPHVRTGKPALAGISAMMDKLLTQVEPTAFPVQLAKRARSVAKLFRP
jgi:hypothetical protein